MEQIGGTAVIVDTKNPANKITIMKLGRIREIRKADADGKYIISNDGNLDRGNYYNYWGHGVTQDIFLAHRFRAQDILSPAGNAHGEEIVFQIIQSETYEIPSWMFLVSYTSKDGEQKRRSVWAQSEADATSKIEDFGELIFSMKEC